MKIFQLHRLIYGSLVLLMMTAGNACFGQLNPRIDIGFTVSFFDQETAPNEDPALVASFDNSNRVAFELGYGYEFRVNQGLGFYAGLFYSERGGGYKTKNPDVVYVNQFNGQQVDDAYNYLRYRLAYFEIPLLVKFNLFSILPPQDDESALNLFAGVSPMVNVGSKLRYNVFEGSSDVDEKWESEKLDGAEVFVIAWNAGVEWRGGPLIFYGRYSAALTDVYDTSKDGFENYDVKMATVSFGMAFLLNY